MSQNLHTCNCRYHPLDLQLLRGALRAHAPAGPLLFHGIHQEGVSMLHLAVRAAVSELPNIITQWARFIRDSVVQKRTGSNVGADDKEYLAIAGYDGNMADVVREIVPSLLEFSSTFNVIHTWLEGKIKVCAYDCLKCSLEAHCHKNH